MDGATANVEHVSPSIADAETAEAIPITSSNVAAMVPSTSQQDRTIKATAIVEPNNPGIIAKKNVVPTYKDQAQSVIHQDPPYTADTSGLAEIGDADAIPSQVSPAVPQPYAIAENPVTGVLSQAHGGPLPLPPTQYHQEQQRHLPDPPPR
jgi:hypothetical protein